MYNICCFFLDLWEWKLRSRDCLAFTEVQNQLQICWQLSYRKVCMKLQQSVCSLKKLLVNAKRIPIFYGFGWTTKVVKCGMQNVPSFIFKWRRADVQAHYPQISRSQKKKINNRVYRQCHYIYFISPLFVVLCNSTYLLATTMPTLTWHEWNKDAS